MICTVSVPIRESLKLNSYRSISCSNSVSISWFSFWIIYWIFWLDIVLAISNALPAMPFDGGLLMMGVLDWIYEKSGVPEGEERDRKVGRVGSMISYTMLFILILVLVAIII